jgi:glycosyltransferase involved in cell wall biosynthesis
LFRHVRDLAKGQAELGVDVGIVCDAASGGKEAEKTLSLLAESCTLGLTRVTMPRQAGPADLRAYLAVRKLARKLDVNVLHGHGAKGGAYARIAARGLRRKRHLAAFYTPHGGSLNYAPDTFRGRLHVRLERALAPMTDGIIFESQFAARRFAQTIGHPTCPISIVPNGLYPHEFYEARLNEDAADFVFIGELRQLKGVDILLAALAAQRTVYPATALIVGSGPDEENFRKLVPKLGLDGQVTFSVPLPPRTAFARGRCVVVPSRAESFPYVVLEAAAAQMPIIATDVGGIPEIVEGTSIPLVRPGDIGALATQMRNFLANPKPFLGRAIALQKQVARRLTVDRMTKEVTAFYHQVLDGEPVEAGEQADSTS